MRTHRIECTDEVVLHVQDCGPIGGPPILLLHGFAQCSAIWSRQYVGAHAAPLSDFRLVMPDLRGHGRSDKPSDDRAYLDGKRWADDINCIIAALSLHAPILLAWSYSGLVACDYLRIYGDAALSGVALVCARTKIGSPAARAMSGTLFLDLVPGFVNERADARSRAIEAFLRGLTYRGLDEDDFYAMLGWNTVVPAQVCRALLAREVDNDDVLGTVSKPTWLVHGDRDTSILPIMSEHNARLVRRSTMVTYEDVGHAPFYEAPHRFNNDLSAFAHAAFRQ